MNLEELKKIRKENFIAHKKKKKAYYLKKKFEKKAKESKSVAIDYEKELSGDNFFSKIKEIARIQKEHVDTRKDRIIAKLAEYKSKKQEYYKEHREKRLEYDKAYRDAKKEELKDYRKKYYEENKDKILQKQKEARKAKSSDGK